MKVVTGIRTFFSVLLLAVLIVSLSALPNIYSTKAYITKKCLLDKAYRNNAYSLCDPDGDWLTNREEKKLRTNRFKKDTDSDGLSDGQEVKKYRTNPRKADTDGDGFNDRDEVRAKTNPRDPNDHPLKSTACTVSSNPFDINGNTTGFGIPDGIVGNINSGKTFLSTNCTSCHSADKGTNFSYAQVVAAVTGPKMGFSFPQQNFADVVAYLNRANIPPTPEPNCVLTPTPISISSPTPATQPTASATVQPTPIPGASCTRQPNPFDSSGNTTSFNIPTGIIGNIASGQTQFSQTCYGCHGADRGTNYNYLNLFAAVNGPPMFLTSLTNQKIANLVAYLNRANIPPTPAPDCNPLVTPSPTPSPTPLSDIARGALVYRGSCSSCHTNPRSLRRETSSSINQAILEVRQMNSIQLSADQLSVLVTYLRSL